MKSILPWCYERSKELEILCRLEREKNPNLKTKILLGHRDLKLNIKMKGEQLRAILSIIVLGCGLKFGYDLFQERIIPAVNITNLKNPVELNSFSQGLLNISSQNPEIYAIFSITIAIALGILVAYSFKKIF